MMILTLKACVRQDREVELVQTIRCLSPGIASAKGFQGQGLYRDVENDNCMLIVQQWETREDAESYVRTDTFGVLLGALNVLADSWQTRFDEVSRSQGQEAILAARES